MPYPTGRKYPRPRLCPATTVTGERINNLPRAALAHWRARHVAAERKRKVAASLELVGLADRHSAEEILGLVQLLNRQYGKTIVMVTHDPKAASYASRQLHVDKGQLTDGEARTAA